VTVIDLGVPSLGPAEPAPTSGPLVDTFGRIATDLRVSLTDRCNLRCINDPGFVQPDRPMSAIGG